MDLKLIARVLPLNARYNDAIPTATSVKIGDFGLAHDAYTSGYSKSHITTSLPS